MKNILCFLLLLFVFSCGENKDTKPLFKPFIGTWETFGAWKDDNSQLEWNGVLLKFEQINLDSGVYNTIETPIDSIWHSSGTWTKTNDENTIILDNSIDMTFVVRNDTLWIQKLIGEVGHTCQPDSICLPVLYGNWLFKFRKTND